MAGERTEQASPQRREKASKEGDLLHSRELCSAAGTVAGVILLGLAGPRFLEEWTRSLAAFLSYGAESAWEPSSVNATMGTLVGLVMTVLAPVGLVGAGVAGAALGAGVVQMGGIRIHPQVLGLKIDRINPLSNLKNIFSLRSASRLGKSMIPAAALCIFAVQRIALQWNLPPFSSVRLVALGEDVYELLLAAAWLLFGWALIDYVVEWRSREQRLRMSRQEMRDEYKESEGNPQIRGRIRNLQRQARRRRMQADVAKAAVVITNPDHYAVALDFDFETMDAPKVLAKGRNLLAEEIKVEALWAGIPILENAPLARSLYRSVEPGESIPVELYAAVASILAFLYRQRVEQQMRQRRERATGGNRGNASQPQSVKDATAVIPGFGSRKAGSGPRRGPKREPNRTPNAGSDTASDARPEGERI
jgi:flagellar biosynthetic protein FlhB